MHGRREGEESKSLPRQHMCPVGIDSDKSTTDKVFPSPAGSSIPSDRSRSVPPSSDYFLKDGPEIRSGNCALFQAGNAPPFIGLVRWFKPGEKNNFPSCALVGCTGLLTSNSRSHRYAQAHHLHLTLRSTRSADRS